MTTPSDRVKGATVAITKLKALPSEAVRHPYEIVGSGFCIDPCGIIVTSRHVVDEFLATPALEGASQQGPTGILRPKEAMYINFFENPRGSCGDPLSLAGEEGARIRFELEGLEATFST